MSNKVKYPIFLSSTPSGEDSYDGKSHEKVAKTIIELINENTISKKVIGLEGEWGAGKSNIIKYISKHLPKDEFFTFIFDAWGNQEDLTRRTFLEEIISQLFSKGLLSDKKKWEKKRQLLLAKKSTVNKTFFPKVKPYWIFFSLSFISQLILENLYQNIFIKFDFLPISWPIPKLILFVYLIPAILFVWGLLLSIKDFRAERKRINSDNNISAELKQESVLQTISRIFYWIKGDEIESTETENIIEEEPTVRQFRDYFEDIENDIGSLKLLIVFDNIDRLEQRKVKALWSSIHTFFADDSKHVTSKTWVIVPYYKERLTKFYDDEDDDNKSGNGNSFLNKTFSITFKVPPHIVSDWEGFLNAKITEAFGNELIKRIEKEFITSIFDRFNYGSSAIKPREIIYYVNQLVAYYLQWRNEIISGEIKFRYIALFVLTNDKIHKNPIDNIIQRNYLSGCESLFTDDEDLDTSISALTFNVNKSIADEVLLKRSIKTAIRNGDIPFIKSSKNHISFKKYFKDAFHEVEFHEKKEHLISIINCVSDSLSQKEINSYWNLFCEKGDDSKVFTTEHKTILLHLKPYNQKFLINRLIQNATRNRTDSQHLYDYYEQVTELIEFSKSEKLSVDIYSMLPEIILSPEHYLKIVAEQKENYSKFKVKCVQDALIKHFSIGNTSKINLDILEKELEGLIVINDEYDLDFITKSLIERISNMDVTHQDDFIRSINIIKRLTKEFPLKLTLIDNFYGGLDQKLFDDEAFIYAIAISISNFETAHESHIFRNFLNNLSDEQIEKISTILELFIDIGDFLDSFYSIHHFSNFKSLRKIASKLISLDFPYSQLSISNCLQNFTSITNSAFSGNGNLILQFLNYLNNWNEEYETNDFETIDEEFFAYLSHQELELIRHISSDAISFANNLSQKDIFNALKDNNRNSIILYNLLKYDIITKLSSNYKAAYIDYLNTMLYGEFPIPEPDTFSKLIKKGLDGRNLKSIFTKIRNVIIIAPENYSIPLINYFTPDLIEHGNLSRISNLEFIQFTQRLFKENPNSIQLLTHHIDFTINKIKNCNIDFSNIHDELGLDIKLISNDEIKQRFISELT